MAIVDHRLLNFFLCFPVFQQLQTVIIVIDFTREKKNVSLKKEEKGLKNWLYGSSINSGDERSGISEVTYND